MASGVTSSSATHAPAPASAAASSSVNRVGRASGGRCWSSSTSSCGSLELTAAVVSSSTRATAYCRCMPVRYLSYTAATAASRMSSHASAAATLLQIVASISVGARGGEWGEREVREGEMRASANGGGP